MTARVQVSYLYFTHISFSFHLPLRQGQILKRTELNGHWKWNALVSSFQWLQEYIEMPCIFFIDNQKESMYSNGQSVSFIFSVSLFNIQNLFLMQRQLCVYYRVIASTFTSNRCQIIFPEPDCFHLPPLAQLLAIANQLQAHWLLRLILIIG